MLLLTIQKLILWNTKENNMQSAIKGKRKSINFKALTLFMFAFGLPAYGNQGIIIADLSEKRKVFYPLITFNGAVSGCTAKQIKVKNGREVNSWTLSEKKFRVSILLKSGKKQNNYIM